MIQDILRGVFSMVLKKEGNKGREGPAMQSLRAGSVQLGAWGSPVAEVF